MGELFHEIDEGLGRAEFRLADLRRDPAAIEHDETIGDVEDVVVIVPDEEDRAAGRADLAHEVKDLGRLGIEADLPLILVILAGLSAGVLVGLTNRGRPGSGGAGRAVGSVSYAVDDRNSVAFADARCARQASSMMASFRPNSASI